MIIDSLASTRQSFMMQDMKDMMLQQNEIMLRNEIVGVDSELPAVESSLARLSVGSNNMQSAEVEQSRDELLAEIRHQQASNGSFRRACEDALSETHHKRTGQKIKNVRAIEDSAAFVER